jgi:hypothetical protein
MALPPKNKVPIKQVGQLNKPLVAVNTRLRQNKVKRTRINNIYGVKVD